MRIALILAVIAFAGCGSAEPQPRALAAHAESPASRSVAEARTESATAADTLLVTPGISAVPLTAPPKAAALPTTCTPPTVPAPGTINMATDVTYTSPKGVPVKLDVAWPLTGGPHPIVIIVHGGGWTAGDKKERLPETQMLAGLGYTAVSINYRLDPANLMPAQEADARCAVRWIRANAATYRGDGNRIASLGLSTGAQLAVSLASDSAVAGLDDGTCTLSTSPSVKAAVGYYGPYDLRAGAPYTAQSAPYVQAFLGCAPSACPPKAALASPITHLGATTPPLLLNVGTLDTFLPPAQTTQMYAAAQTAGVNVAMVQVPAGHGFKMFDSGVTLPATCATLAFLAQQIGPVP